MIERHKSPEALVAYVPVVHRGYLDLFHTHTEADMYVLDWDVLDRFDYLRKDIRALAPEQAQLAIEGFKIFPRVRLLGNTALQGIDQEYGRIIMPNDDVSRTLVEAEKLERVEFEPVFLRWDRQNASVNKEVVPDRVVLADDFQNEVIELLYNEAQQATNWWRRVGAAMVKDGRVVVSAHNRNVPTDYTSYIDGDPRSTLRRGVGIEITNDQHAEPIVIGWCAKSIENSTEGAAIYVDTFPCPKCAKDIVYAGFKQVYYIDGYAVTDALDILRAGGVEVIRIETNLEKPSNERELVPYPEK